ncbi:YggS family pyridoxal phosphate-dependent enzyme [Bartonella sp. DGB1]|uniref:YggS family pyridoxal phosphate-dependent enzyme n=1 Tax=Bartonella sp. DGB1 TaxID=3239807 RepID=UPI003523D2B2
MENTINQRILTLKHKILTIAQQSNRTSKALPQLIAVTKLVPPHIIEEAILAGQKIFAENKIQEAITKYPELRNKYPEIELHFIGKLQSNKTFEAVKYFDVIQTIDREKIAQYLAQEMIKQQKFLPCYIQINTGEEPQKAGIKPDAAIDFINKCKNNYKLNIQGLMCIPPAKENPKPHFEMLSSIAKKTNLEYLSMGMSQDYELAIAAGATHIRIGTAIFGKR